MIANTIENAYKNLVKASNKINERKCSLYSVSSTRDCDYSSLDDSKKKEADFLDLIEADVNNALEHLKLAHFTK
jgi:hypothetical protein